MDRPAHGRTGQLRLRPARPQELDWLCGLERRSFATDRISRRGFRRFLTGGTSDLLVARLDGIPAGYILLLYRNRSAIARIYSLAVEPGARGRGIGAALVAAAGKAAAERGCRKVRLEVREEDEKTVRLYERLGFHRMGRRAGYYQDGAAALRMEKVPAAP